MPQLHNTYDRCCDMFLKKHVITSFWILLDLLLHKGKGHTTVFIAKHLEKKKEEQEQKRKNSSLFTLHTIIHKQPRVCFNSVGISSVSLTNYSSSLSSALLMLTAVSQTQLLLTHQNPHLLFAKEAAEDGRDGESHSCPQVIWRCRSNPGIR